MYRESLESLEKAGKYTGTSFELGCHPLETVCSQTVIEAVSPAVKHVCFKEGGLHTAGTYTAPCLSMLKPNNLV